MSYAAMSNTNPAQLRRRLQASGPLGFLMAVFNTLQYLGRPYFFTSAIPRWLEANAPPANAEAFAAATQQFYAEQEVPQAFEMIPHAIIHTYRMYPANRRSTGVQDSPSGARRQKTPNQAIYHTRPLPGGDDYIEDAPGERTERGALLSTGKTPPLWDSPEDIPDIIRPLIDENTVCYVVPWEYDVFVDFTLVAANPFLLEQMHSDLMYILRTYHDRHNSGASNLTGAFHASTSGVSPDLQGDLQGDLPSRTITWRLKQGVAYAFPVDKLAEIYVRLYGEAPK